MQDARLLHYSHCVSDLERSRRFYVDVMGFEVVLEVEFGDEMTARVMGLPGCRFTGLFLKRDNQRIELIAFQEPPPERSPRRRAANEIGHSHLSFYVKNLDAAIAELEAQGVDVEKQTRTLLPSGFECCVIRDPDGFPIELVQHPDLALLPYEMPAVRARG